MPNFTPIAATLRGIQCTLLAIPDDAVNNVAMLVYGLALVYNTPFETRSASLKEIHEAIAQLDLARMRAALEALEPWRAAPRG